MNEAERKAIYTLLVFCQEHTNGPAEAVALLLITSLQILESQRLPHSPSAYDLIRGSLAAMERAAQTYVADCPHTCEPKRNDPENN